MGFCGRYNLSYTVLLVHLERGESTEGQENSTSRRANVPLAKASKGKRQTNISSPTMLMVAPNPLLDPAFMEHTLRTMAAGTTTSTSSVAPRLKRVAMIVQWVTCMKEMGCETFSGEEDVDVTQH